MLCWFCISITGALVHPACWAPAQTLLSQCIEGRTWDHVYTVPQQCRLLVQEPSGDHWLKQLSPFKASSYSKMGDRQLTDGPLKSVVSTESTQNWGKDFFFNFFIFLLFLNFFLNKAVLGLKNNWNQRTGNNKSGLLLPTSWSWGNVPLSLPFVFWCWVLPMLGKCYVTELHLQPALQLFQLFLLIFTLVFLNNMPLFLYSFKVLLLTPQDER